MEYRKNFGQARRLAPTFAPRAAPVAEGFAIEGAWPETSLTNTKEINRRRTSVKSAILRLIFSPVPTSWMFF